MLGCIPVVADDLPVIVQRRGENTALYFIDIKADQFTDAANLTTDIDLKQFGKRVTLFIYLARCQQLRGSAVIIHCNGKYILILYRRPVWPGQILDSASWFICNIDLIIDTCKHIILISAHIRIKRNGQILRLPCIIVGSGPLHILF